MPTNQFYEFPKGEEGYDSLDRIVRAWALANNVPIKVCQSGEHKFENRRRILC